MQRPAIAPVIPAILPLAESTGATPAEMLAAFIVGFEVAARLSRANPNHNGGGAWHTTGTIGTIAAAAACARLLKLPAAEIPDVIGISVSMAAGVNANYGTMTKPLHAGKAARNGDDGGAARRHGFTAARGDRRPRRVRQHLRARARMASRAVQRSRQQIRSGRARLPAQALSVRRRDPHRDRRRAGAARELGPRVADITAIKAGISRYAAGRAGTQYPTNIEAAKFNLQYVVAMRWRTARRGWRPSARRRSRTSASRRWRHGRGRDRSGVRRRARGLSDPAHGHAQGRSDARTAAGLCQRHRQNPMSPAQIEEKFLDCARSHRAGCGEEDPYDVAHACRAGKLATNSGRSCAGLSASTESRLENQTPAPRCAGPAFNRQPTERRRRVVDAACGAGGASSSAAPPPWCRH